MPDIASSLFCLGINVHQFCDICQMVFHEKQMTDSSKIAISDNF